VRRGAAAVLVLLATAGGCGGGNGHDNVVVSATASLTDAFTELASRFEDRTGTAVELNLGPSGSLAQQIVEGAPAHVFASASEETMQPVVDAGLAHAPTAFATNTLAIAVPPGNPAGVSGLADFADRALLLGLCAPDVPCGAYARAVLDAAGIGPVPDTEEPDVRALLTKIEAGELDAGIVYHSDVVAAGPRVDAVSIPPHDNITVTYLVAVLDGAPAPAAAFVDFVHSPDGQAILAAAGFGPP
jgi:molybdate transport system substrate-binding protein